MPQAMRVLSFIPLPVTGSCRERPFREQSPLRRPHGERLMRR